MKKLGTLLGVLTLAGIAFFAIQGCKPKGATPVNVNSLGASAETTSFKEVTSKLDAGGNLYVYLGTEQWLANLSTTVDKLHDVAGSMVTEQDERQAIDNAFGVGSRLIKESGLEDISGIGISSIASEPGLYRNKMVIHHYPGKGDGFLWTIFGKKAHDLDGLSLLPANTAMATFYDVDSAEVWSVIKKQCEESGFPQAKDALKQFQDQFLRNMGIQWEEVVNSLDGEFGMVVTLDESHMVHIPLPTQEAMDVPEPAIMFVLKVKNDAIFKRIDIVMKQRSVPGVISANQNGVEMRTVPVPLPLPITLRPTIGQGGGYLFFATSDTLIQEAMAVKGGKPGLKASDEFKKLSAGIPEQGNQFYFMSQRFGQSMMKIQMQALNSNSQMPPQFKDFMKSLVQPDKAAFSYGVGANTDEGWITVANGNQGSGNVLAASAAAVPAMLAAIAIPNFVKARQTAQQNACINNLRQIQAAKDQWALEKNKPATAVPTWEDIQPYLGRGTIQCSQGGEYQVGAVGESPTCSIPGHVLPNYRPTTNAQRAR